MGKREERECRQKGREVELRKWGKRGKVSGKKGEGEG